MLQTSRDKCLLVVQVNLIEINQSILIFVIIALNQKAINEESEDEAVAEEEWEDK